MIALDDARDFVLAACRQLDPVVMPIDRALGCVAAGDVIATESVPPFVNSAMDGYALRAGDTAGATRSLPVRLRVVGTILAGSTMNGAVAAGQAARIMTGAPLPAGADAVCMLEECAVAGDGSEVLIEGMVAEGTAVRWTGQDVTAGDVVVSAGTVLTPAHLGVLANQGRSSVSVHPRPRLGVVSTGDELVDGSGPLRAGQIRDSNRHSLLALVRREGWEPVDLGTTADNERAIGSILDAAVERCDAVLTSGGVSVGDMDVVKVVLEAKSAGTMRWMQVAIRPAKPFAFGTLAGSGLPVFGLPGNPVSAMVSFELLVRPAGRLLAGHQVPCRPAVPAAADAPFRRRPDGKTHFVRSVVSVGPDGRWHALPLEGQESHQLSSMAAANGLVVLPDGTGVDVGDTVDVMVVDPNGVEGLSQ